MKLYSDKHVALHSRSCAGLTLLELLVVLAIIAVLAGLALRSVSGIFDESRYSANIQQLEAIEDAILGDAGFLHDIGRLPIAMGSDPLVQLSELWEPAALPAFTIASAPGDSEVRMGAGWRGPYLRLGLGRSDLRDAFGREFEWYRADGAVLADGGSVGIFRSLGADGTTGGDDYHADLTVVLEAEGPAVTTGLTDIEINRWQTDLAVRIHRDELGDPPLATDGNRVLMRIYGPVAGELRTLQSATLSVTGGLLNHTFTALPHGPKIIRAYQAAAGDLPADDELPFASAPDWRSVPTNLLVNERLPATPLDLILRNF